MEEYLILKEIRQTNLINDYILKAHTLEQLHIMNIEHEEILDVTSGQISIYCPDKVIGYIDCIRRSREAEVKINELRIKEMNNNARRM